MAFPDASFQAQGAAHKQPDFWSYQRFLKPTVREALHVSFFSIVLTLLTCIIGLVAAVVGDSAATLGYSLESLVDILSSVLVLWRFWGSVGDEAVLALREKRASVMIAGTFVLLAFIVGGTAISHLSKQQAVTDTAMLLGLTIPSFFLLTGLGLLKLHIAKELGSFAMKKDGVCSVAAGVLSFGIAFGIIIYEADASIWWIDAVFAVAISLALGVYGARTLLKNRWWDREFWFPHVVAQQEGGVNDDGVEVVHTHV